MSGLQREWEYWARTVDIETELDDVLKAMGGGGWELVTVVHGAGGLAMLYFKREKS